MLPPAIATKDMFALQRKLLASKTFVTRETHVVSVILGSANTDHSVVYEVRARDQPQLVLESVLIVDPVAHDSVVLP